MLLQTASRVARVARRYMVTGKLRHPPGPMIERFFGDKDCFFVQVGANDGATADPIYALVRANPRWRGIFIEPQADAFARLVANYAHDSRFVFEQCAVSDAEGDCCFYSVALDAIREFGAPVALDFGGSMNRQRVLHHIATRFAAFKDEPESCLTATRVRCEPLMSLLDRNRVERVDVLVVDAESFDYQVLCQLDFARFRPTLILYEHKYLLREDAKSARSLLLREGYRLVNCGQDTLAVRRS